MIWKTTPTQIGRLLRRGTLAAILTGLVSSGLPQSSGEASIQVEGLKDREIFTGKKRFRIPLSEGYRQKATLNGKPVPPRLWIPVTEAGYYELRITRRPLGGTNGVEAEQKTVRFVLEDPERGGSETGLRPWTPRHLIDSPPAAMGSSAFRFVVPSRWPTGVRLPIVVFPSASPHELSLGRNAHIEWADYSDQPIRVKRGYGHGILPAPSQPGQLTLDPSDGPDLTVQVEVPPQWREIEGVDQSEVEWGPDARVKILKNVTIPAETTLTVREGSVILLGPGVNIRVLGHLAIEGTRNEPVVWMPSRPGKPWGGLLLPEDTATLKSNGAIFTGSGANSDWFVDRGIANTHRKEQAFAFLGPGSMAELTDSYLVSHSGQAFHGENATLHLTRCLIQGFATTGQFNGGSVTVRQSALIDFPNDSLRYIDADNDAIYLTKGDHAFHETLIGWCKDDGIDAGGSTGGTVTVDGCRFEACFHEGMALSGTGKQVQVKGSVFLNSGQGVEAGYLSPQVDVRQSLFLENQVGARFGDNYDWGYHGKLQVHDSVLLFNDRDVWGMVFDEWRQKRPQMTIENNLLSSSIPHFPNNTVRDNQAVQKRLANFPRPDGEVGIGFTKTDSEAKAGTNLPKVTVGLSTFSTSKITVEVVVEEGPQNTELNPIVSPSTLTFDPGEIYKELRFSLNNPPTIDAADSFTVRLKNAAGASILSSQARHRVQILNPSRISHALFNKGADWRFRKGRQEASQPATAWRKADYDDSEWFFGSAPFGYGDGPYGTELSDMRHHYTSIFLRKAFTIEHPLDLQWLQFRLEYDDGLILWLNGNEVLRRGVPGQTGDLLPFDATANRSDFDPIKEASTFSVDQLPPLRRGKNQLAAQVFNQRVASSDLMFDLGLFQKEFGDQDADGLPDGWEQRILSRHNANRFDDLRDIDSTVDLDEDGAPTWQEYLARTDPVKPNSVLRLEWTRAENGMRSLHLRAQPHIRYHIKQRNSFSAPSTWEPFYDIAPQPTSRSIVIEIPEAPATEKRFFRVGTLP